MSRLPALLIILFASTVVIAGGDGKRPWEYTSEERIAARTSAAVVASHSKNQHSSGVGSTLSTGKVDAPFVLKGETDAYLFMPSELFGWLLGGIDKDQNFSEGTRSMIASDLKPFGYEEKTFWPAISKASANYTALAAKQRSLAKELEKANPQKQRTIRAEMERAEPALCAARAAALTSARRRLGIRFDEFLYTAVAPHLTLGTVLPDGTTAAHLRYVEGGCR